MSGGRWQHPPAATVSAPRPGPGSSPARTGATGAGRGQGQSGYTGESRDTWGNTGGNVRLHWGYGGYTGRGLGTDRIHIETLEDTLGYGKFCLYQGTHGHIEKHWGNNSYIRDTFSQTWSSIPTLEGQRTKDSVFKHSKVTV